MASQIAQAVILAGGQGTRLRPLTLSLPKPLIPIHGKPFAEYLIELLVKNGIKEIIFLTGYLAEQFPKMLGNGSRFGISIRYSQSAEEDDTGERLRKAAPFLQEKFLLMYGDNYWPLNLEQLTAHHEATGALATVTVYERSDPAKKNNTLVRDGLVRAYDKKRESEGMNGVDIGFFIFSNDVIGMIPSGNVNFESIVLTQLIARQQLAGFITKHPYWGLTDVGRLPNVERALDPKRKVLFLDRDGTINKRAPKAEYVRSWSEFAFLPGTVEAVRKLSDAGYEIYVVSNQSGIARGVVRESDVQDIHAHMQEVLDGAFRSTYYCPHGWDDGCECRKPKAGMLFQAAREHDIDLTRAVFVGDDERDMAAAHAVGARGVFVPSERGISAALPELL